MKFRLTAKLWANLTSLVHSTNFTETGFPEAKHELWGFAAQLRFRGSENFTKFAFAAAKATTVKRGRGVDRVISLAEN